MGGSKSKPTKKTSYKTKNLGPFDSIASERRSARNHAARRGQTGTVLVAHPRPRLLRQRSAPTILVGNNRGKGTAYNGGRRRRSRRRKRKTRHRRKTRRRRRRRRTRRRRRR